MGWSLSIVERFEYEGASAVAAADGNNVAWCCPCGGPVLFVYQNGRRGSSSSVPSKCPKCSSEYYLDPPHGTRGEPPPKNRVAPATVMRILKK